MACLNVLKAEIRSLESAFPKTHPRLQIVSASVDELTCRFIDPSGRKHTVHANITVRFEIVPERVSLSLHFFFSLSLQFQIKFQGYWLPTALLLLIIEPFVSLFPLYSANNVYFVGFVS